MTKRISQLNADGAPDASTIFESERAGISYRLSVPQVKSIILGANTAALDGLTGAADRLAYFTAVGAMALTPLTALARTLLDDANTQTMRATLGIPWAGATTSTSAVNLDTIADTSILGITGSTTNVPAGVLSGSMVTTAVFSSTSMTQIIESRSTDRVLFRRMVSGTWQTWVEMAVISTAGVNTNITSLTGLTTALSIGQGGTGGNTAAAARASLGVLNVGADYIDGLGLVWNSANSISVLPGAAYIPSTGTVLTAAATITKASLALTGTTKYHVYLFSNAGTPDVEIVTTAPSAKYGGTGRTKTGDTTRRYIGSFYTAAANTIIRFKHSGDKIFYLADHTAAPLSVLSNGVATASTNVSLAGCVPETAVSASIFFWSSTANAVVLFFNDADIGAVTTTNSQLSLALGQMVCMDFSISAGAQLINYIYSATPGANGAYARVQGYTFER